MATGKLTGKLLTEAASLSYSQAGIQAYQGNQKWGRNHKMCTQTTLKPVADSTTESGWGSEEQHEGAARKLEGSLKLPRAGEKVQAHPRRDSKPHNIRDQEPELRSKSLEASIHRTEEKCQVLNCQREWNTTFSRGNWQNTEPLQGNIQNIQNTTKIISYVKKKLWNTIKIIRYSCRPTSGPGVRISNQEI